MKTLLIQNKIIKNKLEYSQIITENFKDIESIKNDLFFKNHILFFQEIQLASLNIHTYYTVIFFENIPIFFSYYQFVRPNELTVKKISESNQFSSLIQILLGISQFKVLVLGNILRNNFPAFIHNSLILNQDLSLDFWLEGGETLAKKLKCTALIGKEIEFNSNQAVFLNQNGFFQQIPDIFMDFQIENHWTKIEDYAEMLSRKYASRYKKTTESQNHFEIRLLSISEIEIFQNDLQNLYLETIEEQDFVFSVVNKSFWYSMSQIHSSNFKIYALFISNKMVAFYSTLENDSEIEMYYLGYDKVINKKYNLYFNMLFLGLENAIENKKKTLKLGRSSLDAKLNLGAKRVEKVFLIKLLTIKGKMLDAWMKCQWKDRSVKTIERNPFKKVVEV